MNKSPLNPLHTLRSELIKIATEMGFSVYTGPEMESEYYNFDALNLPKNLNPDPSLTRGSDLRSYITILLFRI